jgi:hypothetical protein
MTKAKDTPRKVPRRAAEDVPAERPQAHESAARRNEPFDFISYAESCLYIRPKAGGLVPFRLNAVQRYLHERAEAQIKETGRVRAIVLKARQPGVSTYVEGRFYWKVTHRMGVRAFILTHRDQATNNLFAIAKRFHDNFPEEKRPKIRASNARELDFGTLDSGYRVGTAKAAGVGRSDTIQFFHGSEVAQWSAAEEHASGVLQAVPEMDDTEVWLESTARGASGLFFNMWRAAERGDSPYIALFVPWHRHDDYRAKVPTGWLPPPAFAEYGALYKLVPEQLYWAVGKNAEIAAADGLGGDEPCWRFRQEYPADAAEAFRAAQEDAFLAAQLVLRARKFAAPPQGHAAIVLGCDFARGARDWNWFIDRQGRQAGRLVNERFHSGDVEDIAGRLARLIDKVNIAMCFLDAGGGGAAVYDILRARGYGRCLSLVNFGAAPRDPRRYANKRAEMWGELRDWLADPGGAAIPDDDVLESELTAPGYKYNANQQVVLEDKDSIRARLGSSTDGGDALALTFAEPVRPKISQPRPAKAQSGYAIHGW